jgi:hypothetical protein
LLTGKHLGLNKYRGCAVDVGFFQTTHRESWCVERTGNRKQIAWLNHTKATRLILYRKTVVRKGRLLCDGDMLPGDHKHAVRKIDAFNISQHMQVWAIHVLELFAGDFRTGWCGCRATKHRDRTSNERTGHP